MKKPWTPPRPLDVELKNGDEVPHWIRKEDFEAKKYEGFRVVKHDEIKKGVVKTPTGETGANEGAVTYKELILMKLPREELEKREAYKEELCKEVDKSLDRARSGKATDRYKVGG